MHRHASTTLPRRECHQRRTTCSRVVALGTGLSTGQRDSNGFATVKILVTATKYLGIRRIVSIVQNKFVGNIFYFQKNSWNFFCKKNICQLNILTKNRKKTVLLNSNLTPLKIFMQIILVLL